jgi:hypothetical protein
MRYHQGIYLIVVREPVQQEIEVRRKSELDGITRRLRQEIQSPEPLRNP